MVELANCPSRPPAPVAILGTWKLEGTYLIYDNYV